MFKTNASPIRDVLIFTYKKCNKSCGIEPFFSTEIENNFFQILNKNVSPYHRNETDDVRACSVNRDVADDCWLKKKNYFLIIFFYFDLNVILRLNVK